MARPQAIYESQLTPEELYKIPTDFKMSLWLRPEDDHWSALVLQFDIAADGDTAADATTSVLELVDDYLASGFEEGCAFEELLRPAPRWLRLKAYFRAWRDSQRPPRKGSAGAGVATRPRPLLREELFLHPHHTTA